MRIGIAADHGGFDLKEKVLKRLLASGHKVVDFGAKELCGQDDYPDYVLPLAKAVTSGNVQRGIAICGSGVGACIAANKVPGIRVRSETGGWKQTRRAQAVHRQARPRHAGNLQLEMESKMTILS